MLSYFILFYPIILSYFIPFYSIITDDISNLWLLLDLIQALKWFWRPRILPTSSILLYPPNEHRPCQIGLGRFVSIKNVLFSGSMFIYQRVQHHQLLEDQMGKWGQLVPNHCLHPRATKAPSLSSGSSSGSVSAPAVLPGELVAGIPYRGYWVRLEDENLWKWWDGYLMYGSKPTKYIENTIFWGSFAHQSTRVLAVLTSNILDQ